MEREAQVLTWELRLGDWTLHSCRTFNTMDNIQKKAFCCSTCNAEGCNISNRMSISATIALEDSETSHAIEYVYNLVYFGLSIG